MNIENLIGVMLFICKLNLVASILSMKVSQAEELVITMSNDSVS